MTRLAPASSVRERTRRERESGSRARGTRRRRPARDATAAAAVASRGEPRRPARRRRPLVLLGLALGPGIDLLDRPALRSIAPVTALAIGWLGAGLGARFEWGSEERRGGKE